MKIEEKKSDLEIAEIADRFNEKYRKNTVLYSRTGLFFIGLMEKVHVWEYSNEEILRAYHNAKKSIVTIDTFDGIGLFGYSLYLLKNRFDDQIYTNQIKHIENIYVNYLDGVDISKFSDLDLFKNITAIVRFLIFIKSHYLLSSHFKQKYEKMLDVILQVNYQNLNFGFSHGLSGVLNFITICEQEHIGSHLRNIQIIQFLFDLIYKNRVKFNNMYIFPVRKENSISVLSNSYPLSWCYGLAGITLSLVSASDILGLNEEKEDLINNFIKMVKTEGILETFKSHMFCHGIGGLIVVLDQLISKNKQDKDQLEECHELVLEKEFKSIKDNKNQFLNYDLNNEKKLVCTKINDSLINGNMSCILSLLNCYDEDKIYEKITCIS